MMRPLLATLLFSVVTLHAQRVQWSSTNALPDSFTNASTTVTFQSAADGAGGTAWLATGSSFTMIPPYYIPITTYAQRLVWLNRSGVPILVDDLSTNGVGVTATIVQLNRGDLLVQFRGTTLTVGPLISIPPQFNTLRRYVITRHGVTFTDTALDLNETITPTATVAAPDRTGFYSVINEAPGVPAFIVRRYKK